jgi:3-methyladenine DNA glycosylase Tag
MEKFRDIQARAAERKGGDDALASLVSQPLSSETLAAKHEDRWLEEFTRKIFQCGFYWSVIDNKWSGFREVFWNFNISKLLMMPPEMLEKIAEDKRIVRNFTKIKTVPINAAMIHYSTQDHGLNFSQFIADWPSSDIIGLWAWLKKGGARLGGNTGPYALRAMGKDTFILSRDVEAYLRAYHHIDGGSQSKRSLNAMQAFFNDMQQQSGLSMQEVSQTVSYSVGDNRVGFE